MKRAVLPLCVCMVLAAGGCYNPTFDSGVTSLNFNTNSVELYYDYPYLGTFELEASLRPYIADKDLMWVDENGSWYDDGAPDGSRNQIQWISHDTGYKVGFVRYQGGFNQGRAWVKLLVSPIPPNIPPIPPQYGRDTFTIEGRVRTKDNQVFLAWVKVTVVDET